MQDKNTIEHLIQTYTDKYPGEKGRCLEINEFLRQFDGPELFNRKNFVGHITASAYIINPAKDSLLLLRHKALKIWLQPGGHVDETDASLFDAALREAEEETGLAKKNLQRVNNFIFDIDSHAIPANDIKKEPPHIHHDISFLFVCDKEAITIDKSELTASKWVTFTELKADDDYIDILDKISAGI